VGAVLRAVNSILTSLLTLTIDVKRTTSRPWFCRQPSRTPRQVFLGSLTTHSVSYQHLILDVEL
jgi:hypothetical protein